MKKVWSVLKSLCKWLIWLYVLYCAIDFMPSVAGGFFAIIAALTLPVRRYQNVYRERKVLRIIRLLVIVAMLLVLMLVPNQALLPYWWNAYEEGAMFELEGVTASEPGALDAFFIFCMNIITPGTKVIAFIYALIKNGFDISAAADIWTAISAACK